MDGGQWMELWGRWMTAVLQGQNQMDMMSGGWGWLRSMKHLSTRNNPYAMPFTSSAAPQFSDSIQHAWEALLKMQQNSIQWMGMVPKGDYQTLTDRAEELEKKVQEQARTIERLQNLLSQTGGENNVVVTQLQDLIGQQSRQFKQLTQSVGDYLKSSTKNV
jgi:uncharacterized coiled-coil protein SlyX